MSTQARGLARITEATIAIAIQPAETLFRDARPGAMCANLRRPIGVRNDGRAFYDRQPAKRHRAARRKELLDRDGRRCVWCGTPEDCAPLTLDHVIPRCLGGSDEDENLQVLCAECNLLKKGQLSSDFDRSDFTVEIVFLG